MQTASKSHPENRAYASPGFCRIDRDGIHVLNRYKQEHLIGWNEVKAIKSPSGQCRHDYLQVITSSRHCNNSVPVADRDHAPSAMEAILSFRPDLKRAS